MKQGRHEGGPCEEGCREEGFSEGARREGRCREEGRSGGRALSKRGAVKERFVNEGCCEEGRRLRRRAWPELPP
eukprot:scaffold1246_cov117-Isochrysis_galbana.AAC.2